MGLVRTIDDKSAYILSPNFVKLPVSRRREGAEDGLAGGALEYPTAVAGEEEGVGELEHFAQPIHDNGLELGGRWRRHPVEADDVEAGAEHLAEEAGSAAAGREVGEVVGALPVSEPWNYVVLYVFHDGFHGLGVVRSGVWEAFFEVAGFDLAANGVFLDVAVVVGEEVDDHVAMVPEFFWVQGVEATSQVALENVGVEAAHWEKRIGDLGVE